MSGDDAAKILAILQSVYSDATVLPETHLGYALALGRYEYAEVMAELPAVMERHEWPQRLPSPKEITDAIPPPWGLYKRYAELRRRIQDGGALTGDDRAELGRVERRLGVPGDSRLGIAAAAPAPALMVGV